MGGATIEVGGFELTTEAIHSTGAWFVREMDRVVDGSVEIYQASGPHDIEMEIHYIKLETGHRWVVAGEAFTGPKWVFGQLNGRLKISVIEKPEGHVLDLTVPHPGKRNKDVYTASKTSIAELSQAHPDIFTLLHAQGAKKIGTRAENIGDTSSRKGFINVILESPDCLAPVVIYLITRPVAMCQEFERLLSTGEVSDETVSHYADMAAQVSGMGGSGIDSVIAGGESVLVEFKPAIWYNHGRAMNEPGYVPSKDPSVSDNIVRTVAGFLNAEGGQLFIGVGDDGSSYGIERDVLLTGRTDMDGLENELTRLLSDAISNEVVATKVKINFPNFKGKTIVRIEVYRAGAPVFMKTNRHRNKFYVRIGNATNTMSVESAYNYISQHEWSQSD
jgi:hypothetical protein